MSGFDFRPDLCRKFLTLAPKAKLPLSCDSDQWGRIDDAAGDKVCTVAAATSEDALMLANMIVTAVNSCAGYAALPDGTWREAFR